mgnify:CR=1 FL=1
MNSIDIKNESALINYCTDNNILPLLFLDNKKFVQMEDLINKILSREVSGEDYNYILLNDLVVRILDELPTMREKLDIEIVKKLLVKLDSNFIDLFFQVPEITNSYFSLINFKLKLLYYFNQQQYSLFNIVERKSLLDDNYLHYFLNESHISLNDWKNILSSAYQSFIQTYNKISQNHLELFNSIVYNTINDLCNCLQNIMPYPTKLRKVVVNYVNYNEEIVRNAEKNSINPYLNKIDPICNYIIDILILIKKDGSRNYIHNVITDLLFYNINFDLKKNIKSLQVL